MTPYSDRNQGIGRLFGVPVIESEHVPDGCLGVLIDTRRRPDPRSPTQVWLDTPPRVHARRIVLEAKRDRRRQQEMAASRAIAMMGPATYRMPSLLSE